jgi:hypothetical protein
MKQMKKTIRAAARLSVAGAFVALGGILSTVTAHAVTPGDIVLGDITVMRLRTASGGVTAEQRASLVQERVNQFLAVPNLKAKDVHIVKSAYGPTIYVRKIKIITVDPGTALDEGVKPDELAKTWAHRLMGIIDQVDIRAPKTPAAPAPGAVTPPPVAPATPPDPNPATPAPATPPTAPATTPTPAAPPTTPTPAAKPDVPATPPPASVPAPAAPAPAGAAGAHETSGTGRTS